MGSELAVWLFDRHVGTLSIAKGRLEPRRKLLKRHPNKPSTEEILKKRLKIQTLLQEVSRSRLKENASVVLYSQNNWESSLDG